MLKRLVYFCLARLLFEDQLNQESAEEFAKIPAEQVSEAVKDNTRLFQCFGKSTKMARLCF
ncbi:hypothetical protein HMPREF9370_1713 [Neisseria wadsworthii 9715]|uniref:Uncharacterized protein n=1 Tax=Neisseria wadsworthii 9715 TaxID=1030841 RepID=G4CRK3_9NEIS|nr:hypothetical protein HMPREF9370_1713 [Neisseria wadsworthii 9715]